MLVTRYLIEGTEINVTSGQIQMTNQMQSTESVGGAVGGSRSGKSMVSRIKVTSNSIVRVALALSLAIAVPGGARVFANPSLSHDEDKKVTGSERKHARVEHFLTVENVRLRYIVAGSGRPVVMIHGNAGDIEDFEYGVIDSLAGDYRVIAFDRPGHGDSQRSGSKSATVEFQARLLHDMLTKLGVERPILVGHSWGGSLALAYALAYPTETSALVLLAPAAFPDKESNRLLRSVVKTPLIGDLSLFLGKSLIGHTMLKNDLERAFYPQPVPDDYLKMAASSWLGTKKLRAYLEDEWTLNGSLGKMSRHYSEIRVPVTIVTGDNDQIVSPKDNAYRLQQLIPQSQLIALENCGHEIPLTRPECIREALAQVLGPQQDNQISLSAAIPTTRATASSATEIH